MGEVGSLWLAPSKGATEKKRSVNVLGEGAWGVWWWWGGDGMGRSLTWRARSGEAIADVAPLTAAAVQRASSVVKCRMVGA